MSRLALRNTLSRTVEPVTMPASGPVRMYTCGPTVYRWAHVGNLRSYLLADLIRRVLLYHGVAVLHVTNITDVGHLRDEGFDRGQDPMLVAAGLESKTPAEIADAYEAGFHADEALVNVLPAHVFPRATGHIAEMQDLARRLEHLGHAYLSDAGNLYYAVASYPGYGRLSGNTLDELRAGHRVDVEPDKRDPADFALWKAAGPGRVLKWGSPWGEGFPGWHLECSAMAMRYLGDRFEIHTGGIDNVFPHHEDEIAQSAPLVGGVPADHFVHGEHLLMDGQKMAKSAGNFERITELRDRGVEPLALRYLAMTVRYGRKLNYSERSVSAAAAALDSLRGRLRSLGPPPVNGPWSAPVPLRAGFSGPRPAGIAEGVAGHQADPDLAAASRRFPLRDRADAPEAPLTSPGRTLHDRFVSAIDDDLDLPAALAVVRETLRSDGSDDERRWLVLDADLVLGLDLDRVWTDDSAARPGPASASLPAEAAALIEARSAARAARDWQRADELREKLAAMGVEVVDGPGGTTWRLASPTRRS
jgi:cysteinyl-tRNA synthetase